MHAVQHERPHLHRRRLTEKGVQYHRAAVVRLAGLVGEDGAHHAIVRVRVTAEQAHDDSAPTPPLVTGLRATRKTRAISTLASPKAVVLRFLIT